MPVRHRKKSATSYLGWVPLSLSERPIRHESTLERDFLHWMPFVSHLVRIEEQPIRIIGQDCDYTPDFNLELRAGPSRLHSVEFTHLIEVKPFRVLQRDWANLRPRMELGLEFSRGKGWNFKILTELEIRPTELPIIQFLRRFLVVLPSPELKAWLLQELVTQPRTLLDLLVRSQQVLGLPPRGSLPTIWHLVATKAVHLSDPPRLDYESLISNAESPASKVWIPGERLTRVLLDPWEVRPLASSAPPPTHIPLSPDSRATGPIQGEDPRWTETTTS